MQAALRMFADRPLTGQGIGSYEVMALDFTDPDANLTSSAHDEYVEVLGEGGLAGGLPFLLLHVVAGVAVWRRLRRGLPVAAGEVPEAPSRPWSSCGRRCSSGSSAPA